MLAQFSIRQLHTVVLASLSFSGLLHAQALTPVQQAIVNASRNVSGPSPASQTTFTWNGRLWTGPWQTDIAGGDGKRMLNAIKRFAAWRISNMGKSIPSTVTNGMQSDLSPTYAGSYATQMINRITNQYDTKTAACRCPVAAPQTEDQTLPFLAIRQQCKEWVDVTVIKAGGTPRAYGTGVQTNPTTFRAGMGLFFPKIPHASIITDISYNSNGTVRAFKVAESNWGVGWSNPGGMVPWSRTLQNVRSLDWLGNNTCRATGTTTTYACQVVSFQ